MATIKEIAKYVGTSSSTVSIVMNGKAKERKISPQMEQKVLEAARKLGYHPSLEARRLRAAQVGEGAEDTLTLAIFWTLPLRETMLVRFLQGSQALNAADSKVVQNIYFYYPGELYRMEGLFHNDRFHAAILYGATPEDVQFLEKAAPTVPIVLTSTGVQTERFSTVVNNLIQTMDLAMRAFKANGGSAMAFCFSSPLEYWDALNTLAQRRGLTLLDYDKPSLGSIEGGYQWVQELVNHHNGILPVDCIFCGSERMGLGVLQALSSLGYEVPSQVRVIVTDVYNLDFEEFSPLPISSISRPIEQMAVEAVAEIQRLLKDPRRKPSHRTVDSDYRPRATCGRVE